MQIEHMGLFTWPEIQLTQATQSKEGSSLLFIPLAPRQIGHIGLFNLRTEPKVRKGPASY